MPVIWSRFGNKHLFELPGGSGSSGGGDNLNVDDLIDVGFRILEDRQAATERTPGRPSAWLLRLRDRYGQTWTTVNTLIVVSTGQRQAMEKQIMALVGNGEHDVTFDLDNAAIFMTDNDRRETWDVGLAGRVRATVDVRGARREVVHLDHTAITRHLPPIRKQARQQLHPVAFRPTVQQLQQARAQLRPTGHTLQAYLQSKTRPNFLGVRFPISFFEPTEPEPERATQFVVPPGRSQAEHHRLAAIRARQLEDEDG